jgi:hypothetical protein
MRIGSKPSREKAGYWLNGRDYTFSDMLMCRDVMVCILFSGRFGEAWLGHFFRDADERCSG